jgi:hypothetical protein
VWRDTVGHAHQLEAVIAFCEQILARPPPARRAGDHERLRAVAAKLARAYGSAHWEGNVLEGARKVLRRRKRILRLSRVEPCSLAQLVYRNMGKRVRELSRLVPLGFEERLLGHWLGGSARCPVATH